jgi:flagellar motor component MotA
MIVKNSNATASDYALGIIVIALSIILFAIILSGAIANPVKVVLIKKVSSGEVFTKFKVKKIKDDVSYIWSTSRAFSEGDTVLVKPHELK